MIARLIRKFFGRVHPAWIVFALTVAFVWDYSFLLPLKLFVVFLHELSHALVGVLTGGQVIEMMFSSDQGGHATIRGGSRFLILSAGYLGSLLWGGAIMLIAARSRFDRQLSLAIGMLTIFVSLYSVRNVFGLLFGTFFGLGMIAISRQLSEKFNDQFLRGIGLISCLYAIFDIKSDILDRSGIHSDAEMLGELTGISSTIWGVVWIGLAIVLSAVFLSLSSPPRERPSAKTSERRGGI